MITSILLNFFSANSTNACTSKVGHVECAILRRTSSRVNFRGQLSQPVGAACAEHNGVSVGGEMTGGGFSDAAARAGDEDYLGFNVCFHRSVCFWNVRCLLSVH